MAGRGYLLAIAEKSSTYAVRYNSTRDGTRHLTLRAVDYLSLIIYFAFVLGIGWLAKRKITTSEDFLTSRHSVPVWITSLAFIAANLGAQEMIGMCASGAKYGIMTAHFYWLGAVPAMVFVGVFMMPFYYGSRARSVPEYLKLRFDEKTRGLNAITFAIMTIFSSGISMYALGLLFELVLGWNFTNSVLLSAAIVLIYTLLGGLTSAIYNEVVQFFLIVLGFAPLSILAVEKAGGWHGMSTQLQPVMTHSWRYVGHASENPMGVQIFGLVAGLGFVLSFGYWCTNFLVVQRAMAANSMSGARQTPLVAAFPKIFMPFVVIVPGIAAVALMSMSSGYTLPLKARRRRLRLRPGIDHADGEVLPVGHARHRPDRVDGFVHVGHGGQCHGIQYCFHLRHLSKLYPPHCAGQPLSLGGARDHGCGCCAFGGNGLSGDALQQHHGFPAVDIRVCECAAVCDVPAGHVLEANDRSRGVYRIADRHHGGGADAWADGGGRQGRLDCIAASISLHDGAELLDRDLLLDGVYGCHDRW